MQGKRVIVIDPQSEYYEVEGRIFLEITPPMFFLETCPGTCIIVFADQIQEVIEVRKAA